jgi:RNA polymerase sigma-70 factor, ECF subfamily
MRYMGSAAAPASAPKNTGVSVASPRTVPPEITELLLACCDGSQKAVAELWEQVYPEVRRIARRYLKHERSSQTIQATALANEAYLKLAGIHRIKWQDRVHFFAVTAAIMRRILVDHARARSRMKRGGGRRVDFSESLMFSSQLNPDIVRLHDALIALEQFDSRKARVVEMRYFGGLTAAEIATVLGVSVQTVHLDWSLAKAWLNRELRRR